MILPGDFKDFTEYFLQVVIFLQKYSWLYEFPITSILVVDIFSKIPEEWVKPFLKLSNDELNNVPTGLYKDDWPHTLIQFLQACQRLTLPVLTSSVPLYKPHAIDDWLQLVPREIWRGMSPKKKNEVEIMSAFVHHECKILDIGKILDLGSGLGYIDRLLLLRGYRILGIESQVKLVKFATIQKENFFPPNIAKNLHYRNMRIKCEFIVEVKEAIYDGLFKTSLTKVKSNVGNKNSGNINKYDWEKLYRDVSATKNSVKVCMIGLHACGDLAVTGIKMYLGLPEVSALVLVPCCYHKMSLRNNGFINEETRFPPEEILYDKNRESCEESFNNFPLSESLTNISQSVGSQFTCRPFLRLANQATNNSWQGWTETDHQQHSFNVLSRAVIELFAQQEGAIFKKCFRRVVKKTTLKGKDFSTYVDDLLSRCEFVNEKDYISFEENKDNIRNGLLNMWEQHKSKLKTAEILTALQMCLEPVAESLVVADRISFLKENRVDNVRVVRMIDNKLSPRCLAYIASKT